MARTLATVVPQIGSSANSPVTFATPVSLPNTPFLTPPQAAAILETLA